jgi:hypothetical protein
MASSERNDPTAIPELSMPESVRQNASLAARSIEVLSLGDPPAVTLKKALSVRSVVSTSSELARRNQEASQDPYLQTLHLIGKGSFGMVFEHTGTTSVLKVEQYPIDSVAESIPKEGSSSAPDIIRSNALWNEMMSHKRLSQAFEKLSHLQVSVHIPQVRDFITPERREWWEEDGWRFPANVNISAEQPRNILRTQRIFPVPQVVREVLIDQYCPANLNKEQEKRNPNNKACLIRLYLGRKSRSSKFFNMRNFPLCRDQMESLDLDIDYIAKGMAQTLAIAHWEAGIDARDVEFVLGSAPLATRSHVPNVEDLETMPENTDLRMGKTIGTELNFMKRSLHMWCLDFNQCRKITKDEAGIETCFQAYRDNDPYFPRPSEEHLWQIFKDNYLQTSRAIVEHRIDRGSIRDLNVSFRDLPALFPARIEKHYLEKSER